VCAISPLHNAGTRKKWACTIRVGRLQQDSGGNHFFLFRDLKGNELEVCQESWVQFGSGGNERGE
jgi:hypothetical protein